MVCIIKIHLCKTEYAEGDAWEESQQKQGWELTVAQIMNSLLPNSDLD